MAEIIPITSKTRSELLALQQTIPIHDTVNVTENGSVIHAPHGRPLTSENLPQTIIIGVEYRRILDCIEALPQELRGHITGFSDMSVEAVVEATGLNGDDARRAKEREATEPFIWSGSDSAYAELEAAMVQTDIRIQRGGRFYHFTGQATKEQAMAKIVRAYQDQEPDTKFLTIALGDGPNDLGMIEAADMGVIMPNPDGATISSTQPHVRTAVAPGPRGWAATMLEISKEYGFTLSET